MLKKITAITKQTLPFLLVLYLFEILSPKIPSEALVTKGMGTEVTEINLSSFRTPPENNSITQSFGCKDIFVNTCKTHHFPPYPCPNHPFHTGSYTCCTSGHLKKTRDQENVNSVQGGLTNLNLGDGGLWNET